MGAGCVISSMRPSGIIGKPSSSMGSAPSGSSSRANISRWLAWRSAQASSSFSAWNERAVTSPSPTNSGGVEGIRVSVPFGRESVGVRGMIVRVPFGRNSVGVGGMIVGPLTRSP
eukprot:141559-Pyramimonas_sp.AAC.1